MCVSASPCSARSIVSICPHPQPSSCSKRFASKKRRNLTQVGSLEMRRGDWLCERPTPGADRELTSVYCDRYSVMLWQMSPIDSGDGSKHTAREDQASYTLTGSLKLSGSDACCARFRTFV